MDCWILHVHVSLRTKFQFKWTIFNFWTKFIQKGYLQSKTEKLNITIEFRLSELFLVLKFSFNWQFWFFGPDLPQKVISFLGLVNEHLYWILHMHLKFWNQICPKRVFSVEREKSERHHWIQLIPINLGTKFQLNLTILIYGINLLRVFRS